MFSNIISIVKKCHKYRPGQKSHDLCLSEKMEIVKIWTTQTTLTKDLTRIINVPSTWASILISIMTRRATRLRLCPGYPLRNLHLNSGNGVHQSATHCVYSTQHIGQHTYKSDILPNLREKEVSSSVSI